MISEGIDNLENDTTVIKDKSKVDSQAQLTYRVS